MKMKEALEVMSENPNGTFQWMTQLLSLLANMGVDGIHENLTPAEVVKIVNKLDKPIRDSVLSVKVIFKEIKYNRRSTDQPVIKNTEDPTSNTNYFYYGFSAFLIATGILVTVTLGGDNLDTETKSNILNFIIEVIKILKPT